MTARIEFRAETGQTLNVWTPDYTEETASEFIRSFRLRERIPAEAAIYARVTKSTATLKY